MKTDSNFKYLYKGSLNSLFENIKMQSKLKKNPNRESIGMTYRNTGCSSTSIHAYIFY